MLVAYVLTYLSINHLKGAEVEDIFSVIAWNSSGFVKNYQTGSAEL